MSTCFECGMPAVFDHHVVPKSRGGKKTVPLCDKCHSKAHHRKHRMTTGVMTKEAMKRKKANGQRVGTVPCGFDLQADGVSLMRNEAEQKVLGLVAELHADGWSQQRIAAELTARGIPTKKGGKRWSHSTIQRLVSRAA